jgi:2-hydroxychromene-2-carboxylate isomerase
MSDRPRSTILLSTVLALRHFTDPGSALAFAFEPQRLQLLWRYGDQLEWDLCMAVRSTERDQNGLDAGRQAAWLRRVRRDSGMPIETAQRRYAAPTVHACRAVVAVRERWPEHADAYLRHLRVLIMGGEMADDSDAFEIAAERTGLPVRELSAYAGSAEVETALQADARAAQGRRCPSIVVAATDAELAEPDLEALTPRAAAAEVAEVLAWAPYPLATIEVAAVCGRPPAVVRAELEASGARFAPVNGDGYWSAGSPRDIAGRMR